MKIEVPIDEDKVGRFLDCLSTEIEKHEDWGGESYFNAAGVFVHELEGNIITRHDSRQRIRLKLALLTNNKLAPIDIRSVGARMNGKTKSEIERMVRDALVATNNRDRERFFLRSIYAYVGNPLDGEYYLPGFRIAPASPNDNLPIINTERIVYIDQTITAATRSKAMATGRVQANLIASLIGFIFGIGLYNTPSEFRWVLDEEDGIAKSRCLELGYRDKRLFPTSMPKKNTECSPGRVVTVDRGDRYHHNILDYNLCLPNDARRLVRIVNGLPIIEQRIIRNAIALYNVAVVYGTYTPSIGLAYRAASIDALAGAKTDNFRAFREIIQRYSPNTDERFIRWFYNEARSAHFHGGVFPGGEFDPLEIGLLGPPDHLFRVSTAHEAAIVTRHVLFHWLLGQGEARGVK